MSTGPRRVLLLMQLALVGLWFLIAPSAEAQFYTTDYDSNHVATVTIVTDAEATDAFEPRPERVSAMVRQGVLHSAGATSVSAAWLSLITRQDVVGLKVYSKPGTFSGTRPAVVAAVAQELIAAGISASNIVVWDREEADLRAAGFFALANSLGVRVAGATAAGWDETNSYDSPIIGSLVYGDLEFGRKDEGVGRKSFVSKLVSQELTKIINITPLLNHNEAGVCGNLYSLAMGSTDNVLRFEGSVTRLAVAVPEIYALPAVGDKVVFNITDALICQYEGGQRGLLHYSAVLNQLRFSRDPVALDVLSLKELEAQRRQAKAPNFRPNPELYRNAALLELGRADVSRIKTDFVK
ncbi:MAG: DUF362 domain-containing protein [Verrucomicrobiae bacterium]|nr:DUF362 domain-containing protein [Verrucomicrobiae bacterium]